MHEVIGLGSSDDHILAASTNPPRERGRANAQPNRPERPDNREMPFALSMRMAHC
jgi:hypothetical protein